MTPNFITCTQALACALRKLKFALLFNLHAKIFNNRVRQNVVRQLLSIGTRVLSAARSVDGNLEILSLPNVADTVKAQQFDGVFDGFALRIEHAGLQSYVNFGFHMVTEVSTASGSELCQNRER